MKNKRIRIVMIIILTLTVIRIVTLQNSYAFYESKNEIEIIDTKVGKMSPKELDKDYDVNVVLYEQGEDNKEYYRVVKNVPVLGYVINKEKSNCDNGKYTINNDGSVKIELVSEEVKKIVCKIYYEKVEGSDIKVYALEEDANGTIEYGNKKYKIVNKIPDSNSYTYIESECEQGSKINYQDNQFIINTNKEDICRSYFDKKNIW